MEPEPHVVELPDFRLALERVAEAFRSLQDTGLNDRAIVLLLHDAIGQKHGVNSVTKVAIRHVIEAAGALPATFARESSEHHGQ